MKKTILFLVAGILLLAHFTAGAQYEDKDCAQIVQKHKNNSP